MSSPWKMLYTMTWLVVLEFLLGAFRSPPVWLGILHVALGVGLALLATANYRQIRATRAPGRVKRTARSMILLASATAAIGFLLYFDVGAGQAIAGSVTIWGALLVVHVFFAVAVLAESAAIGMSYDMWEEREFEAQTAPGEVPTIPGAPRGRAVGRKPGAG